MSSQSVKEIMSELMKQDLYTLLGVEASADQKAIKKAYRKQALKCHPDKHPDDPKAAELFLRLSKVLEILCDLDAKKTYDHLLKARAAAALRNKEYDSKRKKLKDDLEAREKAAETSKYDIARGMEKMQAEIERLRKEGSKQLEEEKRLMREQMRKEKEDALTREENEDNSNLCRLKVRWKTQNFSGEIAPYNEEKLNALFSNYGVVMAVVMSKKKNGSALIEFENPRDAGRAMQLEKGTLEHSLEINMIGHSLASAKTLPASSVSTTNVHNPPLSQSGFDTFESIVLRNLRQAQQHQQLVQQMKKDDT